MIDVDIAQTFLKIAESGSFQDAARQLNVTQSTVSARIRTLEDRLGLRVFDRSKAGASLNSHGLAFRRYAAAIVHAWEEGRRVVNRDASAGDRIGIGGEHNLWTRLLSLWLLELRSEFPAMDVSALAADGPQLVDGLVEGRLDIAVMHFAPAGTGLEVERLMDDELVLVTTDPTGKFEDRYLDIGWPMDPHSKEQREKFVAQARTTIDLGFSSLNYLMLSQAAGYMPRRLVDPHLAVGRLYRVTEAPVFHSPVYAVRRIALESPKLNRALEVLRDLASLAVKGELPPPFWIQST